MRITIKLFATLQKNLFDSEAREIDPGTTAGQVIYGLGIPEEDVALIFINGRHARLTAPLSDGDTLSLFPPVGGG